MWYIDYLRLWGMLENRYGCSEGMSPKIPQKMRTLWFSIVYFGRNSTVALDSWKHEEMITQKRILVWNDQGILCPLCMWAYCIVTHRHFQWSCAANKTKSYFWPLMQYHWKRCFKYEFSHRRIVKHLDPCWAW